MFVYGTYVLEGEADSKFSLSDIWNLFQKPNNTSNFFRQMINCMKAWNYLQKTSDLPLNTEIIRQTHKIMVDGEDVLVGECRKSPAFSGSHIFAQDGYIERYMEDAIFRFHETKKDYPIMATKNLFGNIINIHPFEDGNGRICHLILAHVLIQMKCCLFPVILSSFHRRGRRHYIRARRMFARKPSILYTMTVRSLINCWDKRQDPKFNKDVSFGSAFGCRVIQVYKNIMVAHIKTVGHCFVGIDVSRAVGYNDDDKARRAVQTHIPGRYRMRLEDAQNILRAEVDIDFRLRQDIVLLKEPSLYCFLLHCKKPRAKPFMECVVETVLPREVRKLASAIEQKIIKYRSINRKF